MLKLVIEFDQERIREEQVCTIEELYRRLDRAAVGHLNLKKSVTAFTRMQAGKVI